LTIAIAYCNIAIAISNTMKLGEKIRYLRRIEGVMRGLDREMTQLEVVRAIRKELGKKISQSYISQIESGSRPHLTNTTRLLLARFFKVHPGYLVDDPEGYQTELTTHELAPEDSLDLWLIDGSERFRRDPELSEALVRMASHSDSRRCLLVAGSISEAPELVDRLMAVLRPRGTSGGNGSDSGGLPSRGSVPGAVASFEKPKRRSSDAKPVNS
jgi:transcriptional regulator with XRE-family HTH domain